MSRSIALRLEGIWYDGRPGAWLLTPLSMLFAAGAALRRGAYRVGLRRSQRMSVPVVVVGNLSVGGTGKSPLVAALAMGLKRRGRRVGVLTRGYGAKLTRAVRVDRDSDAALVGDESRMLARDTGLPVVASPDRVAGARELIEQGVEIILCDDGLQHYALARDFEIVVIDAIRGLGNGRLLPAGPLRERETRLASVDAVVVQGESSAPEAWQGRAGRWTLRLVPEAARGVGDPRRWRSLETWRGMRVHAVAGIGRPARFFAMLRAAGLDPIEHPLPDHHVFVASDLSFGDDLPVLMTAKDAVKCRRFADERCWEIPVIADLQPAAGAALLDRIESLLEK